MEPIWSERHSAGDFLAIAQQVRWARHGFLRSQFMKAALAAFPPDRRLSATVAANLLLPFVDPNYRQSSVRLIVRGKTVHIPKRIHFIGLCDAKLGEEPAPLQVVQCLRTRSTDGYERQASLRDILLLNEPWSIPFVVLLAGEYVVEIIEDILVALPALSPEAYIEFVRENRDAMRLLRSRATSYWDCYYRASYPNRSAYPGLAFLHQLEIWAS
jgi:hypothetical protein